MTGKLKSKPSTARDAADAARLQKFGESGDTILAHINPAEARLLDALADGLLDGGGRNPKTGLLSFGMSDAEGPSGHDSNPGGVGGGPAGGQTGGGIGGNTSDGQGGLGGGYGASYGFDNPYGYAPEDTLTRALQEYFTPSVPAAGRFSPPTKDTPGLMGSFLSQITPSLMGMPAFGVAMGLGGAMGRASSPATQAASAAEMGGRGARNSGGNDQRGHDLNEIDTKIAAAGTASGAATAELPRVPPGWTLNPAGQIIPLPDNNPLSKLSGGPAWRDAATNTLMDYVLRGRRGSGLLGW